MCPLLKIVIFFLLLTQLSSAQSILSYINSDTKKEFYSDKLVSKSVTYYTFYNQSGKEYKKEINTFDFNNNVLIELRYDEKGNLKQRLTRSYNELNQKTGTKFENWHPVVGYTVNYTFYEYNDNNFLVSLVEENQYNIKIRETTIINDEKGNPKELIIKLKGKLEGRETAIYDYENNQVEINYFNSSNEFVSKHTSTIFFSKTEPENIVSNYGDILKSTTFENEIKYDKEGNWVKWTSYKISENKKIKKSEIKRVIEYRE